MQYKAQRMRAQKSALPREDVAEEEGYKLSLEGRTNMKHNKRTEKHLQEGEVGGQPWREFKGQYS